MNAIPERATIKLPNLHRSALRSLLDAAPPNYHLDDLLELVIAKGIAALVKGRELPGSHEQAEVATLPMGKRATKGQRVAADFVGFHITADQQAALKELEERNPLVDDDEMGRILLDAGLRALPHDEIAQKRLGDSFTSWFAQAGDTP